MRLTAWIVAPLLFAAALLQVPGPDALGAKPPPATGDIAGAYAFQVKTTWVTIDDGVIHAQKMTERWNLTPLGDSRVAVAIPDAGLVFDGYYGHGMLVWGYHDFDYPFDHYGFLRFAGKPGKTKAKGQVAWVGLDGDELEILKGKRTDDPPEPTKGKARDGKVATHPSAEEIVGTYRLTVKGTMYAPTSGGVEKGRDRLTLTVRLGGDEDVLVRVEEEGSEFPARYREGVLTLSALDDPTEATFGLWARLLVKGKPGKLRFSGPFLSFLDLGQPGDEVEIGKMSAKQLRE